MTKDEALRQIEDICRDMGSGFPYAPTRDILAVLDGIDHRHCEGCRCNEAPDPQEPGESS